MPFKVISTFFPLIKWLAGSPGSLNLYYDQSGVRNMDPVHVHILFGLILFIFANVLILKELGKLSEGWPTYLIPLGLLTLGVLLFLDPVIFHGGSFGAEGFQHQIQGLVVTAVGIIEFLRVRWKLKGFIFSAAVPLMMIFVGLTFLFHTQHASGDILLQTVQHRILGATIIFAALIKAIDNFRLARGNWASVGWLLVLIVVAFELVLYQESGANSASAHIGH